MADKSWYGSRMRVARVQMPDGRIARVEVPEDAHPDQITAFAHSAVQQATDSPPKTQAPRPPEKPTSFWQGLGEELGKAGSNAQWMLDQLSGRGIAKAITGLPMPSDITRAQVRNASANSPYRGSTAGKITGGIIGTLPTMLVPGGALAQGAVAGGLLTEDPNNTMGLAKEVALGAASNKVGEQVGRRVLAPIAERIGRAAPVRAIGEAVAGQVNRAIPNGVRLPPTAPRITRSERIVSKAAPDVQDIRQTLQQAAGLKLPMSLADTDPRLRTLAGSVTRFSPDARKLAEETFTPRALGQADRAVNGIDELLAPITDIKKRAGDIIDAGKPVYGPLYDKAYAAPVISSPRLEQVLKTPAGRQAVNRASTIAANEFRDPKAMGFVLDEAGNTVLEPTIPMSLTTVGRPGGAPVQQPGYTTQSLDYMKRGIDDLLEPLRNPITGKLNLDESGRAIAGVKSALLGELDNLNPDYRAAREAYQGFAKRAEALRTGHDMLPSGTLPQRDFEAILARQTPDTLPEAQRGYATALADQVDRARRSANPYEAVYGSPQQQGKMASLFPEGAPRFDRQYQLEKEMAATKNEVLGGSQTQPRNIADQMFQGGIASDAADMGIQALSGGGIPGATKVLGMVAQRFRDQSKLGMMGAQKKATEIAPSLFDTNPQAALSYLDDLLKKQAEERARAEVYRRASGLLGVPVAAGAIGSSN